MQILKVDCPPRKPGESHTEHYNQWEARAAAARAGDWLGRNNRGAFTNPNGQLVYFGLDNEGDKEAPRSSDLIGIRRRLITPDMVGKVIGQFFAREIKKDGFKVPRGPDKTLQGQIDFINFVNEMGGDAAFYFNDQS